MMTSHPIAVNMHMSKDEAAETMRKHKLHHLLVTNDEGKFYGLISSFDIARGDGVRRQSMVCHNQLNFCIRMNFDTLGHGRDPRRITISYT